MATAIEYDNGVGELESPKDKKGGLATVVVATPAPSDAYYADRDPGRYAPPPSPGPQEYAYYADRDPGRYAPPPDPQTAHNARQIQEAQQMSQASAATPSPQAPSTGGYVDAGPVPVPSGTPAPGGLVTQVPQTQPPQMGRSVLPPPAQYLPRQAPPAPPQAAPQVGSVLPHTAPQPTWLDRFKEAQARQQPIAHSLPPPTGNGPHLPAAVRSYSEVLKNLLNKGHSYVGALRDTVGK